MGQQLGRTHTPPPRQSHTWAGRLDRLGRPWPPGRRPIAGQGRPIEDWSVRSAAHPAPPMKATHGPFPRWQGSQLDCS
jgi:hypothetical protein